MKDDKDDRHVDHSWHSDESSQRVKRMKEKMAAVPRKTLRATLRRKTDPQTRSTELDITSYDNMEYGPPNNGKKPRVSNGANGGYTDPLEIIFHKELKKTGLGDIGSHTLITLVTKQL
jgi:hypothetical protein